MDMYNENLKFYSYSSEGSPTGARVLEGQWDARLSCGALSAAPAPAWVTTAYPVPAVNVAHSRLLAQTLRTVAQLKGEGHSEGVEDPTMLH